MIVLGEEIIKKEAFDVGVKYLGITFDRSFWLQVVVAVLLIWVAGTSSPFKCVEKKIVKDTNYGFIASARVLAIVFILNFSFFSCRIRNCFRRLLFWNNLFSSSVFHQTSLISQL